MQHSGNLEFDTRGYFVAENVVPDSRFRELENNLPDTSRSGTRKLLEIDSFSKLCRDIRDKPSANFILSGLTAIQGIYFHKTRSHNWSVQFHRDKVIPMNGTGPWKRAGIKEGLKSVTAPFDFLEKCVAVRVALDECEDGDLRVIPGSHLSQFDKVKKKEEVVKIPKGSALILSPNLLHASSKLVISSSRRVLHYLFAPAQPPHNYEWYHAA